MSGLSVQNLETLDVSKLTPHTPEVISRQATINIGTIGHVAHGKSTVVRAVSGTSTVRFKNELERNITIRLGYANAKLYRCTSPSAERPDSYASFNSRKEDSYNGPQGPMELVRHISFVDCPGHDILMATMLNGAAVMDGALLLISAKEDCPQPQTLEHLAAIEILSLKNIIIVHNKIDLVTREAAVEQCAKVVDLVAGSVAEGAPIVPVSAQLKYNIDVLVELLCTHIPTPVRDFTCAPQMIVIRSFDVNKPGTEEQDMLGGVAGGSILKGVLRMHQEVEVRPGIVVRTERGQFKYKPIQTVIISLRAEQNDLQYAVPGGLIGVGTMVDPQLTRADRMVGHVLGNVNDLPPVYVQLDINFFLLRRLLGVKKEEAGGEGGSSTKTKTRVGKLQKDEVLMVNIGSMSVGCRVLAVKNDIGKLQLNNPVCTSINAKVALSRRVDRHWRLIGWGTIQAGKEAEQV